MNTASFDPHFTASHSYNSPDRQPGLLSRLCPSPYFYLRSLFGPVLHLGILAQLGKCNDQAWVLNSARVARLLESVGCRFNVQGMENITAMDGPCVFVANHMSTLETFVLPSIIRPRKPVTFVVKQSLISTPIFGPVMRSRNPVTVGRVNPRQDLQTILTEGKKRLDAGISIVVFPQSTRTPHFDPVKFNSIGVKLAKHSGYPVVPLALQTSAWGQGKIFKDFGKIDRTRTIYFRFGEPLRVQEQGKVEQAHICNFVQQCLAQWEQAGPCA